MHLNTHAKCRSSKFNLKLFKKEKRGSLKTWKHINADNETFCTVLLTCQVVMVLSLQPKGREFESTCVLVFLFS